MATSGSFTAKKGSYLNLILDWSRVETDIANNRSKIRLTLKLQQTGNGIYFSASKSGSLHGEGFTYTGGFNGSGTKTLRTRDVWINHNSDGSKSQSFSASINLNINYEGSTLGTFSVSGTANIDTIPRASSLSSFSFGSALKTGTANTVKLGISRASSSFTHDIQLRDGSTVIASWNAQGLPTSLNLSASQVNTLLGRMSAQISKSFTLRVQTKNGSTNIGSAVTRNASVSVDTSVVPSISGLSVSVAGSGRDKTIDKYVQSISKASASFSSSANGGTHLTSNRIYIRKVGGTDSTTIHATSGTSSLLTSSGTYEAVAEAVDARGRKSTQRVTFTVEAYDTPRISIFSADRGSATPTTVNVRRAGSHTSLGGSNLLTIKVQKRSGTGAWVDINSATTTGSASTFDATFADTGNLVTQSYEFRLHISDQFGNSAESIVTVPTSKVVLDIHKNEGVGIGKIHERGELDVLGNAYFSGEMSLSHPDTPNNEIKLIAKTEDYGNAGLDITTRNPNSVAYIDFFTTKIDDGGSGDSRIASSGGDPDVMNRGSLRLSSGHIHLDGHTGVSVNSTQIASSGTNANGEWFKFYNGLMIVWREINTTIKIENAQAGVVRSELYRYSFPSAFVVPPTVNVTIDSNVPVWWAHNTAHGTGFDGYMVSYSNRNITGKRIIYTAIGRWR